MDRDQAGFLHDRHEFAQRHQAARRMLPAQQRLGADDAPARQIDDRLVVQHELLAFQRAPQLRLHRQALGHARRHGRGVELVAVSSALLGVVHGGIGGLDQGIGLALVERIERNADRGGDVKLAFVHLERLAQHVQHLLRHHDRLIGMGQVLENDRELVTAQACHGIDLARATTEASGDVLEQAVAQRVSEAVVDGLESVQVEEQQCHQVFLPVGAVDGLLQAVAEQRAVGQVGQRVVKRQVVELRLVAHQFGDVLARGNEVRDPALIILQRQDGLVLEVVRAIAFLVQQHIAEGAALQQACPHLPENSWSCLPDLRDVRFLSQCLLAGITGDLLETGIDVLDDAVEVRDANDVARVLDDARKHAHLVLGLPALGHFHLEHPVLGLEVVERGAQARRSPGRPVPAAGLAPPCRRAAMVLMPDSSTWISPRLSVRARVSSFPSPRRLTVSARCSIGSLTPRAMYLPSTAAMASRTG